MRTVLACLALASLPGLLAAQGVTTAAIEGDVAQADGSPIEGATVRVTNTSNGRRWEIVTSASGRYVLEEVGIGGPYRVEVRALGFATARKDGIVLTLGQRFVAVFTLQPAPIELPELIVTSMAHRVLDPGRMGPSEVISGATIAALPNPNRDFLALTLLSPHARFSPSAGAAPSGGISIGGLNRLYNSFQIDGGLGHDLYQGRLPGREPSNDRAAALSPDGRWLAYVSDVSGRDEVYVGGFPVRGVPVQVSSAGGREPRWSPDGRELFYRGAEGMVAVTLEVGTELRVGGWAVLFDDRPYVLPPQGTAYDVHPDGQRFAMVRRGSKRGDIVVVFNLFEQLRAR